MNRATSLLRRHSLQGEASLVQPENVYSRIRDDIIKGHIPADSRLKIRDLAARYGVSTNPIREALQQLRGEGFVIITPNRGARIRPIDEIFLRDTNEIELLLEPYLTRCFAEAVTINHIKQLEAIQDEIEALKFLNLDRHYELDTCFHWLMYEMHPNRQILDMWCKYRGVLGAVTSRFPITIGRQSAVIEEHRAVIACLKIHDAAGAEAVIRRHVSGSGRHMIQQLRAAKLFL
jgi:DNA-binding GntR family transcriptional regulator